MTNQEKKSILLTKLAILEGLVSDLSLLSDYDRNLADNILHFSKCDIDLFNNNPKFRASFEEIVQRVEGDIEALIMLVSNGDDND